jgi:xanthine dehydrogenase accessory factor
MGTPRRARRGRHPIAGHTISGFAGDPLDPRPRMRDLLDILTAAERLATAGEAATLATVVRVEGSSYRLPGARMLVDAAGRRTGSVSGGCLESDVARRGRLLSADRPTTVVRYDAGHDGSGEDAAWGFALGCNGSIDVLIERLDPAATTHLGFLRRCVRDRRRGAVLHVFQVDGDLGVLPGARLAVLDDGTIAADPAALGDRFTAMAADAAECVRTGESVTVIYETAGGRLHVLAEAVVPPVPVVIFGGGHDALPLVAAAKGLGWHVTICDRRAGHARPDRFPLADAVLVADAAAVPDRVSLSADTVAVVMTHHYPEDRALLRLLLASPARYVGVLGPRARTDRMLADLAVGERFKPDQLDRLHAPVGLDLGGDGSEAVALSVVAEIQATLARRPGGPLRDRVGPIHPPARVRHAALG